MSKTSDLVLLLRKSADSAHRAWHDIIKAKVLEFGEVKLEDEDMPNLDEDDLSPRIFTMDGEHGFVYNPSFDKARVVVNDYGSDLQFHVKDGDSYAEDGAWLRENDFADNAYEELLDYIVWPDE